MQIRGNKNINIKQPIVSFHSYSEVLQGSLDHRRRIHPRRRICRLIKAHGKETARSSQASLARQRRKNDEEAFCARDPRDLSSDWQNDVMCWEFQILRKSILLLVARRLVGFVRGNDDKASGSSRPQSAWLRTSGGGLLHPASE